MQRITISEFLVYLVELIPVDFSQYSYSNDKILSQTFLPAETAIAKHNDVIQLLANLGADLSLGVKMSQNSYVNDQDKVTLLNAVRLGITNVEKEIKQVKKVSEAPSDTLLPTVDGGWKGYVAQLKKKIKEVQSEQNSDKQDDPWPTANRLRELEELKQYFIDTERILVAHGAKTWNEAFPTQKVIETPTSEDIEIKDDPTVERKNIYRLHSTYYNMPAAPMHQSKLYDELYEACFSGDDAKIQQFCLPPEGSKQKDVLQISVQTNEDDNRWGEYRYQLLWYFDD